MPVYSKLYANEFIIDDDNFSSHAVDMVVDGEQMSRGLIPRDYDLIPFGDCFGAQPFALPLIPRSEWPDRIREMEATKTRLSDLILSTYSTGKPLTSLNQNGTNYCWINGVVTGMETMLLAMGQPFVRLSPASVGAPIKGYRNVGGWGQEGLAYIVAHGICTLDEWPANAISRQHDTEANRQARAKRKVFEFDELRPRNVDELMTMVLNRIPVAVGYNWWSHEVCGMDPVLLGNDNYGLRIRNSWGESYGEKGFAVLSGSRMVPDDACCPRVPAPITG